MKLWLAYWSDYDNCQHYGVFSTVEKAKDACQDTTKDTLAWRENNWGGETADGHEVESFVLDEPDVA